MIKIIALIICFTTRAVFVSAQSLTGFFGEVFAGPAAHFSPSMQRDLRAPSLLGMDFTMNRAALAFGGTAYFISANRLLLGVSAVGYRVEGKSSRGESQFTIGGGSINFGYLLWNDDKFLSFLYAGAGGNIMILELRNKTTESFTMRSRSISPGQYGRFSSPGVGLDAGLAFKFLSTSMWKRGAKGRMVFGIQGGTFIFAGIQDWEEMATEDRIPTLAQALSFSPYIRLTVGYGTFTLTRSRNRWVARSRG
jgi:hypothetical protein